MILAKNKQSAMAKEKFEQETCLLIELIAEMCLENTVLHEEQREYFIKHSDLWVRWLYVNNPRWTKAINGASSREFVYNFVEHWAKSFVKDPVRYVEKHPIQTLLGESNET